LKVIAIIFFIIYLHPLFEKQLREERQAEGREDEAG